jgi:hypothetical protein
MALWIIVARKSFYPAKDTFVKILFKEGLDKYLSVIEIHMALIRRTCGLIVK